MLISFLQFTGIKHKFMFKSEIIRVNKCFLVVYVFCCFLFASKLQIQFADKTTDNNNKNTTKTHLRVYYVQICIHVYTLIYTKI